MIQKSSHSRGFWVPAQGGKSLKGQVGPMGASLSFKPWVLSVPESQVSPQAG